MERDYGKKNGEKHAGEKKGEGEYLSPIKFRKSANSTRRENAALVLAHQR